MKVVRYFAVLPLAGALAAGASHGALAQTKELTLAHFIAPAHPVAKWIESWAKNLEEKSAGKVKFNIIPNAQLGPPPKYYDIARRGQADITWFLHGGTPGRFPLSELTNLPFMFCSGEHASKVIDDAELRKDFLDVEHKGVKILMLFAHVPGQLFMSSKPVRTVDDIKGTAIRPASRTIGAFVAALGARPVGLPPTQLAENMQKGTIDGTFMDFVAGATAFKLGPVTKYITETYSYTTSFGLAMNPASHEGLSAEIRTMIEDSLKGRAGEIGGQWDKLDPRTKKMLSNEGTEIIRMAPEELRKLKAVGAKVRQDWVKKLDRDGLPASKVLERMESLADKYKAESTNFCPEA